jgi:ribosome-binding protein aMBF1 (putative translation factor)
VKAARRADATRRVEVKQRLEQRRKAQSALAPARCLAHWIISQRTVHIVLASKSSALKHDKPLSTYHPLPGNLIVTARKEAGLTQERLAEMVRIHRQWIGRWERGRAVPDTTAWAKLGEILSLPPEP